MAARRAAKRRIAATGGCGEARQAEAHRVEAQTTPPAQLAGGPHGVAVEPVVRAAYFREVGHYQLKG